VNLDLPKMAVLLAAAIGAMSCAKTRTCKTGTLLVEITLDTDTAGADYVDLDVAVEGTNVGTFKKISTAARGTGSIEVSFAQGYPAGETVTVTATAKTNKDLVLLGVLTATKTLAAACDVIHVPAPAMDAGIDKPDTSDPDHRDADAVDRTGDGPDGGGEVAACGPGRHPCPGAICGDDTSVETCGTRCDPCPLPPNAAQATCDGTTCGVVCKSAFHLCGGACVSDMAVETCGASCGACSVPQGGTATCDGMTCGGQCPANQKLCAGACIAMDQSCLDKCPSGKHDCNGLCVADSSPGSCGTSCSACSTPTNGTATCSAGACGVTCNTGYKKCSDDSCVPTSACCSSSDCPALTNGIATCGAGHACVTACNNGFHLCGSTCASNLAVATCGTSCTACTAPGGGGSATCENGTCGASCPAGTRLCLGTCIGPSSPCNESCPTGTHNCSGQCLSDSSVNSCGTTSCTTCPAPANATPTCAGGSCGWTCNASYRTCNNACIPSGSCCTATDCPGATNGTATCSAGHTCGITCKTGYHLCGNVCSDNTSIASCGAACSACNVPAGGSASCTNGVCGAGCPNGYTLCANECIPISRACNGSCLSGTHNCSGQCLPNSSPSSCGATSCTPCPAPANATATCTNGTCGYQCNSNYQPCKGACIPSGSCCDNTDCSGGTCLSGTCCPAGQTNCDGTCVDLQASAANCGACHAACSLSCNQGTCEDCSGTSGNWDGCRGSGCWVCSEAVMGFPKYFQNHPHCAKNDTCMNVFYTCNSKCPPPSAADM
jgi:hypothetical protein